MAMSNTAPQKRNPGSGLGVTTGLSYIGFMRRLQILLISICIAYLPGISLAGDKDDHLKARQLVQEGAILPLEQIIERTRLQHPGRILEVEFEQEHNRYVYEIELVDETGQVWELEYDAETGELIEKEQEK
jgi:hypothetical protein